MCASWPRRSGDPRRIGHILCVLTARLEIGIFGYIAGICNCSARGRVVQSPLIRRLFGQQFSCSLRRKLGPDVGAQFLTSFRNGRPKAASCPDGQPCVSSAAISRICAIATRSGVFVATEYAIGQIVQREGGVGRVALVTSFSSMFMWLLSRQSECGLQCSGGASGNGGYLGQALHARDDRENGSGARPTWRYKPGVIADIGVSGAAQSKLSPRSMGLERDEPSFIQWAHPSLPDRAWHRNGIGA